MCVCTRCHISADIVSHCMSCVNKHSQFASCSDEISGFFHIYPHILDNDIIIYTEASMYPALTVTNLKCLHRHMHKVEHDSV